MAFLKLLFFVAFVFLPDDLKATRPSDGYYGASPAQSRVENSYDRGVNWYQQLGLEFLCPLGNTRYLQINNALKNPEQVCALQVLEDINQTLPLEIGSLSKLKFLNLERLDLEDLPESLGQLIMLKRINLRFNRLHELPEGFEKLKQLQMVDLSGNRLDSLPDPLVKLPQLKWLSLVHNNLSELEKVRIRNLLPHKCRVVF